MLKNKMKVENIWFISALLLPVVSIAMTKVLTPLLGFMNQNSPGMDSRLLVPTSVQSTSYYVSRPDRFHP